MEQIQKIDYTVGGEQCSITMCNRSHASSRIQQASLVIIDSGLISAIKKSQQSRSQFIQEICGTTPYVIAPGGERGKGLSSFSSLLKTFSEFKLGRDDSIVVIGGGAICDTASFAAAVYMRGITLMLVPSTLLAIVDASIGGKTAINFSLYKNMVGAFYPASDILIVPELLATLHTRLLKDGLAETIKAGMLCDEEILKIIEVHGTALCSENFLSNIEIWKDIIWKAVKVKVSVVQKDFKEQGIRAFLNFGHTFGHAHEFWARQRGKDVTHGEAVALGIRAALELGLKCRDDLQPSEGGHEPYTDATYAKRICLLLDSIEYPNSYEGFDAKELVEAMYMDKKRSKSGTRFVMQSNIYKTALVSGIDKELVIQVLQSLGAK